MSVKILHAADLHLDSAFEALGSRKAAARRAEQRGLLTRLAELARQENVDAVLLSGDLLDSENSYYETGEELVRALGNIPAPVFIAPGNHDYYSSASPYARLEFTANVHIFADNAMGFFDLPGLGLRVYGGAFTDRRCAPLLRGLTAPRIPGVVNLLCLHGEVGVPGSAYNPITEAELALSGIDYAALGHVHSFGGLRRAGKTWYSWPGCPEGRGFDECGEKFVSIVELEGDSCYLHQAAIYKRKYETLTVDITDNEPLLAVHTALPENSTEDIYRIILTGETEQAPNLDALYENLSAFFFELQLSDRTRLRRNIWERAGDDSLRGIFLAKLREMYEGSDSEEGRLLAEQAARWGLAALDNMEEVVSHEN